ncbi:MAG: hemin-degrading factor [Bacteroidia bacterium]|nr:hemin-degrading factor [Bacteroidia bacterium]
MENLRAAYEALRAREPHLYLREAAQRLGVSEMALLRLQLGNGVVRLRPEIPALLQALPSFGPLKALSRNPWAVIETTGTYPQPYIEQNVMVFTSPLIDLRIYLSTWKYAFAVRSFGRDGKPLYSIQFFTPWGEAVHKVYLTSSEQVPSWEALVQTYQHPDQSEEVEKIEAAPPPSSTISISTSVQKDLLEAWSRIQDTHEFSGLLRHFKVSRYSAIRAAEGRYSWLLPSDMLQKLLEWARESQTPIMFFIGNAGIHHIYSGTIRSLSSARGWINVLDPDFNLHVDPAGVFQTYLVRKPTKEGDIYSVEVFGPQGEEVLWIFGARKPGLPAPERWLAYVESLRTAQV